MFCTLTKHYKEGNKKGGEESETVSFMKTMKRGKMSEGNRMLKGNYFG
jgi:hypothetical protein